MFSGMVECLGKIKYFSPAGGGSFSKGAYIHILADENFIKDMKKGDSVSVNGVCLTVEDFLGNGFKANVSHETLLKSNMMNLKPGNSVNLEKPLKLSTPLGGHLVLGHVDGTGEILDIKREGIASYFVISRAVELEDYIVPKGSVAVDGISLTVAEIKQEGFSVSVIPHTFHTTNLQFLSRGNRVNLEGDIIGKYVVGFLKKNNHKAAEAHHDKSYMSLLRKAGF